MAALSPLTAAILAAQPNAAELDNIVLGNLTRVITDAHPSTGSVLEFFSYGHLPEHLRDVSRIFAVAAVTVYDQVERTKNGAELTTGLRKLLEAKDCAVRAALSVVPA